MSQEPLKHIVIAGGTAEAWVAAATLTHALGGQNTTITVIDAGHEPQGTPAEATQTRIFHQFLELDLKDMMRIARCTFRLGTDYRHWWRSGQYFYQALGTLGGGIDFLPFHQYLLKRATLGDQPDPDSYSLSAVAARQGRFAIPEDNDDSVLSTLDYGMHIQGDWYHKYLKGFASFIGAQTMNGVVADVALNEQGHINALTLEDGRTIEGDLYIDCTGPESRLLGRALGVAYQDWSGWLPADSAVSIESRAVGPPPPSTTITAMDDGWLREVPMADRNYQEFVYNGGLLDAEAALHRLQSAFNEYAPVPPTFRTFRSGRRESFWVGNCIALGAAAGAMETLAVSPLHLAQTGAMRIVTLLPNRAFSSTLSEEYNRVTAREHDHLRDYLISHYSAVNHRSGNFWQWRDSTPLPDRLDRRLRVFASQGQVPYFDQETFDHEHWAYLLLAQGRWPRDYNRCMDELEWDRLEQRFEGLKNRLPEVAARMPSLAGFMGQLFDPNA